MILVGAAALPLAVVTSCLGIWIPGIEVAFLLFVGWVPYLVRVVPQVTIRWDLVGSTAAYAAALVVGAHFFLRWLHREWRRGDAPAPAWPWWRTLGGLALVLLLFASGTAMVGIVHQTAWLARSPEPMYRRGSPRRDQIVCGSRLRNIGYGLKSYTQTHGGRFPDDLRALVLTEDVTVETFVCPGSSDEFAPGNTLEEQAENLLKGGHCSYLYLGRGLVDPVDPKRVVVVEPVENHDGEGVNVLRADGQVKWLQGAEMDNVLTGLGFERIDVIRR